MSGILDTEGWLEVIWCHCQQANDLCHSVCHLNVKMCIRVGWPSSLSWPHLHFRESLFAVKKKASQTSCTSGISSNGPRTCVPQPDANSQQLKQIWQAITRSEIDEPDAKYTMKWVRCCHVSAWVMFVLSDGAQKFFRAWNQVASLMLWSWKIVHVGCAAWKIEFR